MLEKGKISVTQFTLLVTLFTIGSSILLAPSFLTDQAKQDAWIAAVIGVGIGLLLVLLYNAVARIYPSCNLVETNEKVLGKWLGKFASLLFISFLFLLSAFLLRDMGDFMTTQMFPETPISAIHILFLLVAVMAVRLGLEVFSRAAEIFFPWVILLAVGYMILLAPEIEIQKIQPVLEGGIVPILRGSFTFLGILFFNLLPF
jgi:spore germination protein KB